MILSIVIPVYNAEQYLFECLDSIAKQDYLDFEVILINDGSTDNSEAIIQDFIFKHQDINFVYKKIPNGGPINARLTGVNLSKGEYICFIDADDYIEPNYISSFIKPINEHHPDMICCNRFVNEKEKVIDQKYKDQYLDLNEIEDYIYPYLIQDIHYDYIRPNLWSKVFKKDIYLRNVCKKDIRIGEDLVVTIPMILDSKSMFLISAPLYHYRVVNSSMINSKKPRLYSDPIQIFEVLSEKIKGQEDIFLQQLYRLVAHVAFNCSVTQFYADRSKKETIEFIKQNLDHPVIKEAIDHIDGKGLKAKLMIHALKHRRYGLMKLYSKFM